MEKELEDTKNSVDLLLREYESMLGKNLREVEWLKAKNNMIKDLNEHLQVIDADLLSRPAQEALKAH